MLRQGKGYTDKRFEDHVQNLDFLDAENEA